MNTHTDGLGPRHLLPQILEHRMKKLDKLLKKIRKKIRRHGRSRELQRLLREVRKRIRKNKGSGSKSSGRVTTVSDRINGYCLATRQHGGKSL